MAKNTIFTNTARTPDGDVWWEGKDNPRPENLIDWQGRPYQAGRGECAAHPNSRFTAPMANNPALCPPERTAAGVPISAILFGGRRPNTVPLVVEAYDWAQGVYFGATLGSQTTAAASGTVGVVRRDPMAMLPFCGYDMGNYLQHWLEIRRRLTNPPQIFMVNWFRKDDEGRLLWPGYGENLRVLQWIIDRCHQRLDAKKTAIGWIPKLRDLYLDKLETRPDAVAAALRVDLAEWRTELESHAEWFDKLGSTVPLTLTSIRELFLNRILAEQDAEPMLSRFLSLGEQYANPRG